MVAKARSFLLGMVNEAYREAFRKQLEEARAKHGENPPDVIDLTPLQPVKQTERFNWPAVRSGVALRIPTQSGH